MTITIKCFYKVLWQYKNIKTGEIFMKKSLLAMIILSTAAFGANPGEKVPTQSGHKGQVGVPMEVRVTVLPQGPQLVLLDENDILINKLTFDHGSMVAGLSQK